MFSCIFQHKNADELSFNLNINMEKSLEYFKNVNHVLPNKIIFYRVKSGNYNLEFVKETEVVPLINAIKKIYTKKQELPHFSYIMVDKFNNTRLFKKDETHENPMPGTIVDDFITFSDR